MPAIELLGMCTILMVCTIRVEAFCPYVVVQYRIHVSQYISMHILLRDI